MVATTDVNPVVRFIDAMNSGDIDALDDIIAAHYIQHSPGVPPGREGAKQFFTMLLNAFPDAHFTLEDLITSGDKSVARWSFAATHKGELLGIPPTGNKVSVTGIDIVRMENGKYAEHWDNWDQLGMLRQLGAIPQAGS